MMASLARTALLAATFIVGLSGCAHWQQTGAVDVAPKDDLTAWRHSLFGGGSHVELPSNPKPADSEEPAVQQASHEQPVRPAAAISDSSRTPCAACNDTCCESTLAPCCETCPIIRACGHCSDCLAGRECKLFTKPNPGPPPDRYRPCLPPKFLPVPTQPVLSPARPDAPDPWRGDTERAWRSQLTFPARD